MIANFCSHFWLKNAKNITFNKVNLNNYHSLANRQPS